MAKAAGGAKSASVIRVQFFGGFLLWADDTVINDTSSRARRPWTLLQYLMVNRHKNHTRQQLIDALWPEGTSDQPDKALKNLVYRVRSAFAAKGLPFAQEVVLYRGGNYYLNNELPWRFDFEELETLYKTATDAKATEEESIQALLAAIGLYKGDFLAEQAYEDWVLPYNTHYRSLFFKCVQRALAMLEEAGRDEEIERVCTTALAIDPFEEELHLAYMNALIRQEKKSTALNHYNKVADLFFRELGVTPGDALRELYQELSQSLNSEERDLFSIKGALSEQEYNNDAFYCDFEVFRSLYRLEARSAERAGQAVFVGLLSLSGAKEGGPPSDDTVNKCMAQLLQTIHQSLRRGDVVSRFSTSQYILMLPTITVENAQMVLTRVKERFDRLECARQMELDVKIQPLDPVMKE